VVVTIEHPSGTIAVDLDVDLRGNDPQIRRAALIRTARRLMEGFVHVPDDLITALNDTQS
jgi:2-methylaconitate cis-trans-isomerase PrpF